MPLILNPNKHLLLRLWASCQASRTDKMYTFIPILLPLILQLIEANDLNITNATPGNLINIPLGPAEIQDLCTNFDSQPNACYLAKGICSDPRDLVNFKSIYYCALERSLPLMLTLSLLLLIVFFYILYYCSEYYLSIPLQRLVLAVEMDSQIAGVTLLSFANGAPDFFTALAGSGSGDGPPGSGLPLIIGALLGSGMFTTCVTMAISILVSQPRVDIPTNEHPFDSTDPTDHLSNIREDQAILNPHDRSWIILPRGFFVNLGVYFSGFILLVTLCSTLSLNLAYPPIQFSLYLIYMVYTIYPRFQTRIQNILNGSWPPTIFKATNSQFNSFEVPTVIITSPDMVNHEDSDGPFGDSPCSATASNYQNNSLNGHNIPQLIIIQDTDPIENGFKPKPGHKKHPEAPRSMLDQLHSNLSSHPILPRLSIPEANSPKVPTGLNPIANLKHNTNFRQKQTEVRDVSEVLMRFGFQDSSDSWGLLRLFQVKLDELREKDSPRSLPSWVLAVLTFPITVPFFISVIPSLGTWTLIDRGTEAWDEVDFNFDIIGDSGPETGTDKPCYTLTTSRALILRQLIAMPEAGISNFRRFQALTFLGLGVVGTISLGYVTQPIFFGIPGPAAGLLVGLIIGILAYCLNYTLPSTAAQYRESLARYLESSDSESISPLHLSPLHLPQEEPSCLQNSFPRNSNTLHVTLSPEFIEVGDRSSGSEKSSELRLSGEPGPSHMACTPPSPSIPLHRMPSWATTFDALNGKSSAHSSPILESSSLPSLSANHRLREFLTKVKPDLRPLDFIFYIDCCVLVIGIVISISYINAVSSLLVELLQVLASILGLPSALVGMTVLAWGNSISDLVSAVGMAKGGYPMIALTSTLAGPVLNLLLTFGTSLCSLLIRDNPINLSSVPNVTWVAIFFIAINCGLIAALALPTRLVSGQVRRPGLSFLPYLQIANFFLFLVSLITVQVVFD